MLNPIHQTAASHDISLETHEEVQHYRVRLEILKSISAHLTSAMSVQDTIERALVLVQKYFPTLRVSYSTIDADGKLTVIYSTNPAGMSLLTGLEINLHEAPAYLAALRASQIVSASDITQSEMLAPITGALGAGGTVACLDVPLNHLDKLIGLLCLDSPETRTWSNFEETLLTDVAEHLTVAIRLAGEEQERKQAEAALRESEERFRQMAENTTDLFWLFDTHTRQAIYLGPTFEAIWGRSREEIYQNIDLFWQTMHPDDRQHVQTLMQSIRTREVRAEARIVRPDGTLRWIRLRMFPVRNSAGEVYRYAGIVQDITDHKFSQATEREQHIFAEALSETAEFLNSTLDVEEVFGRILIGMQKVTPAADLAILTLIQEGMAYMTRSQVYTEIGGSWAVPKDGLPIQDYRNMREAVETRKAVAIPDVRAYEGWIDLPGNESLRAFVNAPIFLDKEVIGLLSLGSATPGTFQPIHAERLETFAGQASTAIRNARLYAEISRHALELEKRVAERTVELSLVNEKLQGILDATGEGICYCEGWTVQYTNHAFAEMLGFTESELNHQLLPSVDSLVASHDFADKLSEIIASAARRDPGVWRSELRLRRKNGTEFDAGITISWVGGLDGVTVGAVIVLRDIGEEKSLQAQKDRFIANASHELRTPLTNITLRLYLLDKQPERFREHIKVIESVTGTMRNLVEDLLDVSRFERGIITLDRETVNLQTLIRDVVNTLSSDSEHKSINLTSVLPPEPLAASIDTRRMRQVLTNLIMNGLHYTQSGGSVTVTLHSHDVDGQHCATIQVHDTGIGMATETLSRIFEPFFRASESGASGTGLGLTISREIVELHGGTIGVESQPGEGSTFSVVLPLSASNPDLLDG